MSIDGHRQFQFLRRANRLVRSALRDAGQVVDHEQAQVGNPIGRCELYRADADRDIFRNRKPEGDFAGAGAIRFVGRDAGHLGRETGPQLLRAIQVFAEEGDRRGFTGRDGGRYGIIQ